MVALTSTRPFAAAGMVLILAALAAAPTIAAIGHHVHPVVLEGGGAGSGWVAITVHNDGSPMRFYVTSIAVDPPGHTGIYRFDDAGNYVGGAQVIVIGSNGDAHIDVQPTEGEGISVVVETLDGPHYGGGVLMRYCDLGCPGAFTARAVFVTAGDAQEWSWSVTGEGATVLAIEEGSGTVAMTGRDFAGGAHASPYAYGVGARAEALRTMTLEAQNTAMTTFFTSEVTGRAVTTVQRPDDSERICPCTFGGGPGVYKFDIVAGAGAGPTNFHETYLGFADVRLTP